jgi:hypothetical protein
MSFLQSFSEIRLDFIINHIILGIVFNVFRQHAHFVPFVWVSNSFTDQEMDHLVPQFKIWNAEGIMTGVVTSRVLVGSTLPIIIHVLWVKNFVLLKCWV